jgi:tetratricopeptide (TPR) repeat protein
METQLLAMTQFLPKALLLWLFPAQLNIDHTRFEPLTWTEPSVLLGIAVIALPLLLALLWLRKRSLFSIGVLGAMAFALPWILVPLNVPLAEHRLYVPVLLLSIPAGAALSRLELASILVSRARWLAFAPVLILGLLSVRSVFRSLDWHEPKQLWQSALSKNDQSFRACCGLADLEREAGRLRASIAHLEAANTIYPRYLPARRNECEIWLRIAELGQASPGEVAHMVQIVEAFAEERWKDPFVRLQASRARIAAYRVNSDAADLRKARSWALSCLAMVERKMLVYQQASESERAGQDFEQALALFDTCREHGLENPLFLAAMGDCLVEAEAYPEAGRLLRSLTNSPVTESCVLGFAVRLAEATQDARLLHWAKGGLMQLQFGVAVPPR